MATEITAEKVKAELRDRGHEIDDEEFEEQVQEYKERFGKHGDEGLAVFAVAKQEYGEKIQSEFVVDDRGTPPGEQERYTIAEIVENGKGLYQTDENFIVEGLVISKWFSQSEDGKPRWYIRIMDESGEQLRAMASGTDAVANFESSDVELGDFVRISSVTVLHDDDRGSMLMIGQYVKYEHVEPTFELAEVIDTNVVTDPTKDGDVVFIEGIVADYDDTVYQGCENCSKGWDPEETNACPQCGSTSIGQLTFDTLKIRSEGMEPMEVLFPPDVQLDVEDPPFETLRVYGTYNLTSDDSGSQTKQVRGFDYHNVSADGPVEVEETAEEPEPESAEESEADEEHEPEREAPETESEYDIHEAAERIEEQVMDMEFPVPATSSRRFVTSSLEVPDEDADEVLAQAIRLAESWGTITVTIKEDADGGTMEEARWQNVIIEKAGD